MEYVKIFDSSIPKGKKMKYEAWLSMLYNHNYKGFNLIFGNVLEQVDQVTQKKKNGALRVYTNVNASLSDPVPFEPPAELLTNKCYGVSNGAFNKWAKVVNGKYDFFQEFLAAEKAVKEVDHSSEEALT